MENCGNCMDCIYSMFDDLWGEYKCKILQHRIYILLDSTECEFYLKGEKNENKT